jgi:hypothetical protein
MPAMAAMLYRHQGYLQRLTSLYEEQSTLDTSTNLRVLTTYSSYPYFSTSLSLCLSLLHLTTRYLLQPNTLT